ncbi:hypothetical protein [Alloalcanivorax xenomutans]|uniref:DUF2730 family protein n=1 Tax=Alloalcanivorax xenomutans TaxID=1094342 RepID=A0A9Q3ZI34_9GAMM|nr:hypothetical protein [Alloalcanivorax xenomutans]MCE7510287.1 hypothetical protein [Alloalcanivorax xenomutans]CUR45532.1 hypothetical protein BN2364_1091 [Alloalcanivorax xenomutans]
MMNWYHGFQVLWAVGSAVVTWWLWLEGRRQKQQKDRSKELATIKKDLSDHRNHTRQRMSEIELRHEALAKDLNSMPTHQEIRELTEKIERTNRQLSDMVGEFRAINRTVQLVNEYFINRGDRQ